MHWMYDTYLHIYIDIYISNSAVELTSVGLAHARSNNIIIMKTHRSTR